MTGKSELWDITAEARVVFKRVYFEEAVTEKEAKARFLAGEFNYFDEAETGHDEAIKIISAEAY